MKVGLVRHFKVNTDYKEERVDWKKYSDLMREYDHLDVTPTDVDLRGIDWNKCYASSLPRAITTAETIYEGDIEKTPLIKEVEVHLVEEVEGEKYIEDWNIYTSLSWAKGKPTIAETIDESRYRSRKFLEELEKKSNQEDNVLVVCHGTIMTILEEELRNKGFAGEEIVYAENGELYLYEK